LGDFDLGLVGLGKDAGGEYRSKVSSKRCPKGVEDLCSKDQQRKIKRGDRQAFDSMATSGF
jgi:hypothetical protein